jgi:hypothetical protein
VPDLANAGFYTTAVTATPANIDTDWADIGNTMGKWQNMVNSIQTQDSNANNLSAFRAKGQQGYTAVYGNDFQTALPFAAMWSLGELYFVKERVNFDDFVTGELDVFPGKWNFNIANGAASLGYSANVAEVPVPAAERYTKAPTLSLPTCMVLAVPVPLAKPVVFNCTCCQLPLVSLYFIKTQAASQLMASRQELSQLMSNCTCMVLLAALLPVVVTFFTSMLLAFSCVATRKNRVKSKNFNFIY